MSDAILLLRIEHDQIRDLLKIVGDQLGPDGELDLGLVSSIIGYLREYPDRCHHPVEDLVFRFLKKRSPDRAGDVSQILHDHESLAAATERVHSLVDAAVAGHANDNEELSNVLKEFVNTYRAHIAAEEEHFFSLAMETLDSADWAEVEYALFESSDPLYDEDAEDKYRLLRRQIEKRAVSAFQRGARLRELRTLGELTGIEAFNETMRKMRSSYRLVEHPEGSFGLEHKGDAIIDIPKCSSARAAWCAYFHVAALSGGRTGKAMEA